MHISEMEIQVRYAETDQMGVVYHANYIIWFELGRTRLIEELGFKYADMENYGYLSPVVDVQASYKKPVKYGEKAFVRTWVEEYNGIRTVYHYEILNEQRELCVEGSSTHVVVKKETFKPVSLKKVFPNWHLAYEQAKKQNNTNNH
jgi:acyl-CoA thioester hydrolase